jgi:hypothetical protein
MKNSSSMLEFYPEILAQLVEGEEGYQLMSWLPDSFSYKIVH